MTCERALRSERRSPPPVSGFRAWLARSGSGEVFDYHRGLLSADRAPGSELGERRRRIAAELGNAAMRAADDGRVHLVQRRNGEFDFSYLAIKSATGGATEVIHHAA